VVTAAAPCRRTVALTCPFPALRRLPPLQVLNGLELQPDVAAEYAHAGLGNFCFPVRAAQAAAPAAAVCYAREAPPSHPF
jgi:hypothetical protein